MAQKGIFISSWLEYYLLDQCRILPLDTMMTWIFFQVVLHLTKVIHNFLSQQFLWNFLLNFRNPWRKFLKNCDMFLLWVLLQATKTRCWWLASQNKQKMSHFFSRILSKNFWSSAKNFKEIVKIKWRVITMKFWITFVKWKTTWKDLQVIIGMYF